MFSTRSTRLAVALFLALLAGWSVRAWRKSEPKSLPPAAQPAPVEINPVPKSSFPDE